MTANTSVAKHAAPLAERAGEVALCQDFEGNLSPIVDDPEAARPLRGIVELHEPLPTGSPLSPSSRAARPRTWPSMPQRLASRYLGLYDLQEIRDGQVWVDRAWSRPAPRSSRPARPCGTARRSRQRRLAGGQGKP